MRGGNLIEALKALPVTSSGVMSMAQEEVEYCNRLFAIERELRDITPEERYKERLKRSVPVLDAFWAYLKYQKPIRFKYRYGRYMNLLIEKAEYYLAFTKYPETLRKHIYTTNGVESVNNLIEKVRIKSGWIFQFC